MSQKYKFSIGNNLFGEPVAEIRKKKNGEYKPAYMLYIQKKTGGQNELKKMLKKETLTDKEKELAINKLETGQVVNIQEIIAEIEAEELPDAEILDDFDL